MGGSAAAVTVRGGNSNGGKTPQPLRRVDSEVDTLPVTTSLLLKEGMMPDKELYEAKEQVIARTPLLRLVRDAELVPASKLLRRADAKGQGGAAKLLLETVGLFGETCLHLCTLYHSQDHIDIARVLIAKGGRALVNAGMTSAKNAGETALHIAIMKQDKELVTLLLEHGADVQSRAVGSFFRKGGDCYYGEYPLSFAVSIGQPELVRVLIQYGADIFAQDSHGNTAAHLAVLHDQGPMYAVLKEFEPQPIRNSPFIPSNEDLKGDGGAITHTKDHKLPTFQEGTLALSQDKVARKKQSEEEEELARGRPRREEEARVFHPRLRYQYNKKGYSPMMLAAKVGSPDTFTQVLGSERKVLWTYNCSRSSGYPSHTFREAFRVLVEFKRVDLITLPLLRQAVEQMWNAGGRRMFLAHLVIAIVYAAIFTAGVQNCSMVIGVESTPNAVSASSSSSSPSHDGGASTAGSRSLSGGSLADGEVGEKGSDLLAACAVESTVLLSICLPIAVVSTVATVYSFGSKVARYKTNKGKAIRRFMQTPDLFLLLQWIHTVCFVIGFISIMVIEDGGAVSLSILGVAGLCAWLFLLYYVSALALLGEFVAVVVRVVTHDMTNFVSIYLVSILGFTTAMTVVFAGTGAYGFTDFSTTAHTMVVSSIGYFDPHAYEEANSPAIGNALFFACIALNNFSLMSLLVALMFDTFALLSSTREANFLLQRAAAILDLERRFATDLLLKKSSTSRSSLFHRVFFFLPRRGGGGEHRNNTLSRLDSKVSYGSSVAPETTASQSGSELLPATKSEDMWIVVEHLSTEERDEILSREAEANKKKKEVITGPAVIKAADRFLSLLKRDAGAVGRKTSLQSSPQLLAAAASTMKRSSTMRKITLSVERPGY